jgi:hypothetical protein
VVFEIRDLIELQVLQKALMAARFSGDDQVLLGSPYISVLHTMIVDQLISQNRAEGNRGGAAGWEKWRQFSKARREWDHVRTQLSRPRGGWPNIPQPEKADFVRSCFAPFDVPAELIDEMVMLLDQPTPGTLLVEEDDRWILPWEGRMVEQCRVDWALTLGIEGEYEVQIDGPFTFRTEAGVLQRLELELDPAGLGVLLRVVRGRVASAVVFKDGRLELDFVGGAGIVVAAEHLQVEAGDDSIVV